NFFNEEFTVSQFKEEISRQRELRAMIGEQIPERLGIGPFLINVRKLRAELQKKHEDIVDKLLVAYVERLAVQVRQILTEFEGMMDRLSEQPIDIEQLFEMREYMNAVPLAVANLTEQLQRLKIEYDVLEHFCYNLSDDDFNAFWSARRYPTRILRIIDETSKVLLELEKEVFYKVQLEDQIQINDRIDFVMGAMTGIATQNDLAKVYEIAKEVKNVGKLIREVQEFGLMLNARQKLFGMPVVPFEKITMLVKSFEPYQNFWLTANDWTKRQDEWMNKPMAKIDGAEIEGVVNEMYKTIVKCTKMFPEQPEMIDLVVEVKQQIEGFRPYIGIIQALTNPGMKPRHFEELSRIAETDMSMSPELTFQDLLENDILSLEETIKEISETAAREFAIERSLEKMRTAWETLQMDVVPYKDTGTYIMKIADETMLLLDDHILSTQQISFSPFKGAFEEDIDVWTASLKLTQQVTLLWGEVQKIWMYLEPIFASEDISRQLPVESKKYNTMERNWRRIMLQASEKPLIMEICPDQMLLESLRECMNLLEVVQKGLADYLESRRMIFPRFFFLSDDELLEILAQAKNVKAVQPHLKKCFENMHGLRFEKSLWITRMYSAEGEEVALQARIYPDGGVEHWLGKVEEAMRNTVRYKISQAVKNVEKLPRKKWVFLWPGQVSLCVGQMSWTAHVEKAIGDRNLAGYFKTMMQQLDDLRNLVREQRTDIERMMLEAIITIEVHARDVTQKLVETRVRSVNDFDWISQLRYYWVDDAHLKVRAVNAEFQYGLVYLGNNGRLVITPLTDRCYLTLTGALHLKFGGAPAGPAGTGKTETTKDLAKAFAIQCVVFNCSDQLDFMSMGKFFKGLASSGAWACFDEFNRIDIEVLSVIAQQIMTIQRAQMVGADRFYFEGTELSLRASCAVFITMNPGYAGRTELPDNLKALFRPVAMMVPNYALIAEISLFSCGFGEAKSLAAKITATFKLSSEQLSSQDHYDFGMRSVKTVILTAGILKREQKDMAEQQICLRALRDVNVPKFLKDDLILFNGITSDLFPRVEEKVIDYDELIGAIHTSIKEMKLAIVGVIQLYETTIVRHGLMLVGPTGAGKTRVSTHIHTLHTIRRPNGKPYTPVHTYVLNPKSITMGQLYGEYDLGTHEWTDGILSTLIRDGSAATDDDKRWYVFDGPVDAVWIENMNTVLDDNKKLCLTSGEIMRLSPCQTMMFEVEDLRVASPATVSRCGMVYMEPQGLGIDPFIDCWIKQLPGYEKSLDMDNPNSERDLMKWVKWHDDLPSITIRPDQQFSGTYDTYCTHSRARNNRFARAQAHPPARGGLQQLLEMSLLLLLHFADIEIPTVDMARSTALIHYLLTTECNILCVGPSGSGKTLTVAAKLSREMPSKYICEFIIFSARTSANQTQDLIDSKLDKRRRGVYGPPLTKKQIFFIDDLNMPALETYGAQPPIELLRQYMDFKGWYDRKEIGDFRHIEDVNVISAMAPPGGGRNPVTARLLRHFHFIAFPDMDESAKVNYDVFLEPLLSGSLRVFAIVSSEFLPTPSKSHYSFNVRDFGKVFQGILMADPAHIKQVDDLMQLWYHESYRVYSDRLTNDADRQRFQNILLQTLIEEFHYDANRVRREGVLYYGDFCNPEGRYERVREAKKMEKVLMEMLENYNSQTTVPMNLVLFQDAMNHVCRITRVLRQSPGNALLLGMGGSGEFSLTKLSTHIAEYICFQIELSKTYGVRDWRDDVKDILLKTGLKPGTQSVFLFSDTQIKSDVFLEDINNILNSGDVPNIYQPDELDKIFQAMRARVQESGLQINRSNLLSAFRKVVKNNLHVVLTMTPIGELFRARIRQFPALINLCTIDWFDPWPDSALQEHSRHNYVTPTSYLELISSYGHLLAKKRNELNLGISRLSTGKARPMLQAAEESLKALNKADITEVKAMKRPPVGVVLVIEAICIVKKVKPLKVAGERPGEKLNDYWTPGSALLSDAGHFLSSLENYNKEDLNEDMIKSLKGYIENPDFQPAKVATVSKACHSLCLWVHAMYNYYFVNERVKPKMQALREAEEGLRQTELTLAAAVDKLRQVEVGVELLQAKFRRGEAKQAELERQKQLCEDRMSRAVRLIGGLAEEKVRWAETVALIRHDLKNIIGDILLSAGAIAYLTPFMDTYRKRLLTSWYRTLGKNVPHTPGCSPVSVLGDPVEIRRWQIEGLPRDSLSVENAVLVTNSKRWPLFIDPQGQANHWIRNSGKQGGLSIVRMNDKDLLRVIESCIRFGRTCLIENVGLEFEASLDTVLMRTLFRQAGVLSLKIGDNIVPYSPDFRLYLTTKLPNPHYPPEIAVKVLLVNFTLTASGLADQMLSLVVMQECPDLEETRSALIVSSADMKRELRDIEDRILQRLSSSEGSAVDDVDLILTLEASKVKSEEIKIKVKSAEVTQAEIEAARSLYIPIAERAQILFFCLLDLQLVDTMYQYSLQWFIQIFINAMRTSPKNENVEIRVSSINENLTFSLFTNVCRSLFEKHKLHFAFLLCVRIRMKDNLIDPDEWRFLLSGSTPLKEEQNPAPQWLTQRSWSEIQSLEALPKFRGFAASFKSLLAKFKIIFDSQQPEAEKLPDKWDQKLDDFQKMLVLKCLRPDKVTISMQHYIIAHLGGRFVDLQSSGLEAIYKESSPTTPLIFVLSSGTDPAAELAKFADKLKMSRKLYSMSLGQGQGPRAELMLKQSIEVGNWLFFQNCHLAPSWLPRLELLVENLPDSTHRDFRLWLTSMPSPAFPVSILQNGSKMTIEPPRGVKANVMRAYTSRVVEFQEFLESENVKVDPFKCLAFSLCLFHAILLERRKFGPLGFNIPYEFTDGDFTICLSQLHMFLLEYARTPYEVLIYTAGHINYGGRITDDWDRRCVLTLLHNFYNESVLETGHCFDPNELYVQPPPGNTTFLDYVNLIKSFPINDVPGLFGLHSNADISYAQAETYACLNTLLELQPSIRAIQKRYVTNALTFVLLRAHCSHASCTFFFFFSNRYPVSYEESLNSVLYQEAARYNVLLDEMRKSLSDLLRALQGLVVLSETLEAMASAMFSNRVPNNWTSKAFSSLKPLGARAEAKNSPRRRLRRLRPLPRGMPLGRHFPGRVSAQGAVHEHETDAVSARGQSQEARGRLLRVPGVQDGGQGRHAEHHRPLDQLRPARGDTLPRVTLALDHKGRGAHLFARLLRHSNNNETVDTDKEDSEKENSNDSAINDSVKCGKKFGNKRILLLHITKVHESHEDFASAKCEKKFVEQGNLIRHQKTVHEDQRGVAIKAYNDYACDDCTKNFTQKSSLLHHQKTVHDGRKHFTCNKCEKIFGSKSHLLDHQKTTHEGRKDHACGKCERKFGKRGTLFRHQRTVHEGRKDYPCDNCQKKFGFKSNLLLHKRTVHEGRKDYACDKCEKKFGERSNLIRHHKTIHEGRKDYACDDCKKKFSSRENMLYHQRTFHEGRKDYACNNCKKKFSKRESLFYHQRTFHEDRKDYSCEKCEKKFGQRSDLLKHQRTVHEGRKDYICEICEKKFGQKVNLLFHQKTVHEGRKDFACNMCEKVFRQKYFLLVHQKTVHEGRKDFACDKCEKKFTQKQNLLTHRKTVHEGRKDYACDKCEKKFGEKSTLIRHLNTVHEGRKDYACNNCDKKFKHKSYLLKHQKLVHEGRKDYTCDKCEKKFGDKSNLSKHQLTVHKDH
ncbi:unnamed protein product, partial [Trichogramma brassicae]